jgi:PAS domain S-box-containing protein
MFGLRSARSRAIFGCLVVLAFGISAVALAGTTEATGQTGRTTLWLTIGLSVAAFVVVAGVPVLVVSVLRPLAALRASARAIAAGDLEARAKVSGPEEVTSLARDFNAMTDALSAKAKEYIDTTNLTKVTIMRVDKDNRISLVNDAMCEFLGKSREEILGTPIVDYLHPEDAPSTIRAVLNMVQSKGLVTGIVSRYATPRGTRIVEWNGYPIFDEEGRYAGVHGTGRDISERKRAEEALRESEQRFRTLSDAAFEGIAIHDKGKIVDANQTYAEMFGYQPSEIIGMHALDFAAPESRDLVWQAILSGREEPLEAIGLRKDGSTFVGEILGKAIPYQGRMVTMAAIRDITERKRAEEALRESEKRYRLIAENATDVIWTMDTNLRMTYVSPSIARLRGYTVEEAMGQTVKEMLTPASLQVVKKAIAKERLIEQMEAKDPARSPTLELEQNRKDGSTVWTEIKVAFLRGEHGQVVGILGIGRDISERKQAEEALRESEKHYRLLAENATDVIWTMDTNLRFTYVSPSVTRLRGYTVQEVMGQTVKEMLTPASLQVVKKAIAAEETIEESKEKDLSRSPTVEVEQTCKDGSTVWTEVKFAILRDPDGQAIGSLGISRDITERKRAEEALNCLYGISVLVDKPSISLQEILQGTAELISESWQYPEVTCARISLEGQQFRTDNFRETAWRQTSDVIVHGQQIGAVEVCYLEERPESDEGPFVKEERALINAIAERLGRITERKIAEDALRESEERLKILFESAPDAYYLHDLEGKFADGNRAAEELSGYKREELRGKGLFESNLFPPEQLPKAAATVANLLRGLPTGPDEFTLIRKGGKHIAVETRGFLVKIRAQTLVLGIARDISERKRAEEALRESEEKYRRVVQDSIDGILIAQGLEMKFVNPALLKMFGCQSEEEMVGHPFTDFIPPEYRELLVERGYAREKGQDEPEQYEYKALRKDGSEFHAEISVTRITYQGKPARQGIVRDVSKRKAAEQALRESEERYRSLVETSPDAIILSDLNTNIIMVNERAVRLLRYDNAEEVIGTNSLEFIAPEDRQRAAENTLRTLQTGTTQSVEYTLLRKDGTSFPAELSASSIVDAQGRPQAFTGVVRDITERKRAEQALQKVREDIESRVERRVQQVNGYGLTFRELAVLHLVAAGESDKEIATVLGISPLTAHKHLANILDKMGAASRTEAGVRALREGLLD